MTQLFKLSIEGPIARITLDSAETHNRLPADQLPYFKQMLTDIEANPALRALVITGAGTKTFCAGYHIGNIQASTSEKLDLGELLGQLERLPIPTIAMLNGSVYGGGVDLSLACDFRIGVDPITVQIPAAKLGVHYYLSGLHRAVEHFGLNIAKRMLLLAEPMNAAQLTACGYLDYCVPQDELESKTAEICARITEYAPIAVSGMKLALNEVARGSVDVERLNKHAMKAAQSEDLKEGARAFLEKRKPVFQGK